jgi:hypothetical protein
LKIERFGWKSYSTFVKERVKLKEFKKNLESNLTIPVSFTYKIMKLRKNLLLVSALGFSGFDQL